MSKAVNIIKWIVAALLAVLLIAGIFVYLLLMDNIVESVTVEVGSAFTAEDFKKRESDVEARFLTDLSPIDLTVPGEYPVTIAYFDHAYESTLCIVDTVAPVVKTRNLTRFSTQYPRPDEFIESMEDNTELTVTYAAAPDPEKTGVQSVQLRVTDLGGNTTLADAELRLIFDSQAPVIEGVKDLRVYVGSPVDVLEGVTVTDADPDAVLTVDDSTVDQTKEGEYTLTYTAVDTCGNTTVVTAVMTVIEDTKGPEILGVNKLSIYEGSTISYRSGIVVRDNYDEAPVLQIDSSHVDLSRPGTYDVIYTATDAAGNATEKKTTITIKERTADYVEESVIYAKADEIIAKIITEDMTPEEQVRAIYKHVHNNYGYVSTSDKTDRLQGAYRMMTKGQGDCYNYYALSSLLFERLGLPQIAVKRSDDSGRGSKHFWNMVSIDGGETYYHYDATPTTSFADDVCLVTDATLDRLERKAVGYFAMDEGVYPATPQTAP